MLTLASLSRGLTHNTRVAEAPDTSWAPNVGRRAATANTYVATKVIHNGGAERVRPLAEHALEIARDTLQHDRGDGDKGTVFHAGGEDGVFLGEVEGVVEGGVLVLGAGTDDDVHFEEGVENVDVCGEEVCLFERRDLDDLLLR